MRLIALSDSHFSERSARWTECLRIHAWIADTVRQERPDAVLHGGDVFDRASTPMERLAVVDFFRLVAEVCPVVIVRGNHEASDRELEILTRIDSLHPIHVIESASVVSLTARGKTAVVGGLAWPSYGSALDGESARDALRSILRGLGQEMASCDASVLLAHAAIDGSKTSAGQPLVGSGINVGLDDLALAGAHAVICGHVHLPQGWTHQDRPIEYVGSTHRTDYGERENKSLIDLRLESGRAAVQRIEIPCRPMLLLEGAWSVDGLTGDLPGDVRSADIRYRYDVAAEHRESAKAAARLLERQWRDAGAADVKLDEVVQVTLRVRAPEVSAARTLAGKLAAYWRSKGDEPAPDIAERLLGPRLARLEGAPEIR